MLDLFQSVYITQKRKPLEFLEIKYMFYGLLSFLSTPIMVNSPGYAYIESAVEFINKHYREICL